MAWLPPVNIPSVRQGDYSSQIFNMLSGAGNAFYQNRRDEVSDQHWDMDYARRLAADEFRRTDADRRYALDQQRLAQNGAGGGVEYYGSPQWYRFGDGPNAKMGFGVLGKDGSFLPVNPPEGSEWAPGVTYQDTGTARVPTYKQGGGIAGSPLPVHGNPEPGTVQTSPGGLPGAPGGGVPGLPGGGVPDVPTYQPVGPKATREQQGYERERTQAQTQARQRLNAAESDAAIVFRTIDELEGLIEGGWATGTTGALMEGPAMLFPSSRGELNAARETLLGNISFDKLQRMRELSPTGGALGQVSDFENRLLQATAGPLNPMNPEQMSATLDNIRRRYQEAIIAHRIAYMTDYEGLPRDVADQAIDAIRAGKDPAAVMMRIEQIAGGQ